MIMLNKKYKVMLYQDELFFYKNVGMIKNFHTHILLLGMKLLCALFSLMQA